MATPERLSLPARVTVTAPVYQPLSCVPDTLAAVLGRVRSILMPPTLALVVLPALSLTEALAERSTPSPVTTLLAGQLPSPVMPERLSLHDQATVTSPLYQPLPLVGPVAEPLSDGAVLSTLMPVTPALALLPAASVAVPLALWFAPSPSVCDAGQTSTPESVSPQVKLTVTSALYQPLPLATRSGAALIVGAVLSMLTVARSVAVLPALSTAVPVTA